MTHRDYKELSAALREAVDAARRRGAGVPPELEQLALRLASHCAADNPRFHRGMFLRNAGLGHLAPDDGTFEVSFKPRSTGDRS